MNGSEQLSASLEDYLEAIFWVIAERGAARGRDVAKRLDVRASSVTGALRTLAEKEYINYAPYELITLTDVGKVEAKKIIRRHEVLRDFFTEVLWIGKDLAEEGACKLEHGIPKEIVDRLVAFTEFVQSCPRAGSDWLRQFARHCLEGVQLECTACVPKCHQKFEEKLAKMNDEEDLVSLSEIAPGRRCIVRSMKSKRTVTKRLVEMGVGRGAVIEVERVAPLGDPIEIKVKGYHLSLRRDEAQNINVVHQEMH
ncbi:DtxR family transcriptional regulator [Planctomycetota bacterium]